MSLINVVVNGGFENESLSPWGSFNAFIKGTESHSGTHSALLGGGNANAYIFQYVPLSAGQNLELLYSLAKNGSAPSKPVSVSMSYYNAAFNFLGTGLIVFTPSSRIPNVTTTDAWLEI